jgi:hypothetical protein
MKIPVLAEHTTPIKWIPFGKLPSEILYDTVTARYVTILTAGYGLTPSDIGMGSSSSGGETLAGTIRQERTSAKSGKSLAKKKVQSYFNNILPEYLQFSWVDFDDEKNVAMSRARMANANAASLWIQMQIASPDEVRRQAIQDGMFTITMPETLDRSAIEWPSRVLTYSGNKGKSGSNQIGDPKAPSMGGQGEVKPQQIISKNRAGIQVSLTKAVYAGNQILGGLINSVRTEKNDFPAWERRFENSVVGKSVMDLMSETIIDDTYNVMAEILEGSSWLDTVSVELANAYLDNTNTRLSIQLSKLQEKQLEQDFISGKSDTLIGEPVRYEPLTISNDLVSQVRLSLVNKLVPLVLLVSEKSITEISDIDTTDITDNNNVKLARSISDKVYELFPQIVKDVEAEIETILGEK